MSITADRTQSVARVFHALSDPTRLRIVDLLRRGERCVCELTEVLDASQPRLSFHLKTLKDAGLVLDRREGRWVHYRLSPEAVERYQAVLELVPKARSRAELSCCR